MELSHASTLFIHHLIYASPLIELRLENVLFQRKYAWELIIDAIDYSLLETFSVSNAAECQNSSAKDRWTFLVAQSLVSLEDWWTMESLAENLEDVEMDD